MIDLHTVAFALDSVGLTLALITVGLSFRLKTKSIRHVAYFAIACLVVSMAAVVL